MKSVPCPLMRRLFYLFYDRRTLGFVLFLAGTSEVFRQAREGALEAFCVFLGLTAMYLLDVAFFVVRRKGALSARTIAVATATAVTYEVTLTMPTFRLEEQIVGLIVLVPTFAYLYGVFVWGDGKPSG
ncbi:MAG TPA: hypothetical protein VMW12_08170 [Candidatus Dormibacteraeota bacterium]|nr:hypothetical protein [Candidatus Dormibacteraeota bacterium]